MDSGLYNKEIECPVCSMKFEVTKVKTKACKVANRDSDFCVHYEGLNPILYDVWVCENCGYAALSDRFEDISTKDAGIIKQSISPRWHKRSFAGERNTEMAVEAFKLALLNLQVRSAKASELAKICLRIAWLYRYANDEREKDFLKFALRNYDEAYQKERFPIDKLDEFTCMFIIAELYRRIGDKENSILWFSRLISSPDARQNAKLIESAREQFQLVKEQGGNNTTSA
ncbi:MAG: DUF2225 domain-containing protein [Clostridia bacterium]|nr:DUF2225 domain-containing protein [Clostridia bacterium]